MRTVGDSPGKFALTLPGTLSSLIPRRRGLVGGKVSAWLGSRGKAPGDPHTTTDSWASPDCSVSGAGPVVVPGRRAEGVINVTFASFAFCVFFLMIYQSWSLVWSTAHLALKCHFTPPRRAT